MLAEIFPCIIHVCYGCIYTYYHFMVVVVDSYCDLFSSCLLYHILFMIHSCHVLLLSFVADLVVICLCHGCMYTLVMTFVTYGS